MKHSRIALGLAASALLTLGACGSDSDDSSDDTVAVTTTAAAAGADTGGSADVTTSTSDDMSSDDTSNDGTTGDATVPDATASDVTVTEDTDDGPSPGDPDFSIPEGTSEQCANLYNKVMSAAGDSSLDDPDSMRDFVEVFTSLKSDLPDDLDDDLDVLAAAYTDYADAVEASGGPTSTDPQVVAALDALGSDEVNTANENISTYLDELCPTLAS